MFTKVLRVTLIAAAAAGVTVAVTHHRPAGPIMVTSTAATSPATRPNATVARNTNVGGATHGDPSGTATFNDNITKMNNGDLSAKEACQAMDDAGTKTLAAGG